MKARKFDTKVQHLKYKVLREVARYAFDDKLERAALEIPSKIISGKEATMRCCIYKERAIVGERIRLAMGGDKENPNVIEVLDIACDECPVGGYEVTDSCRGCIAHHCEEVCPVGAIGFDRHQKAYIDKDKCVNCGKCAGVCPYSAIVNRKRPCEAACKIGAIGKDEQQNASIDNNKCISCGACVYQCPFGAIMDKSYLLEVIRLIRESKNNEAYRLYAVVAPSISSQFSYAKLGQVISAIKKLGFYKVVEAALGADMVAMAESKELMEKGFLTTSCCPAFVTYVRKNYPELMEHVSHNLSPMAAISRRIKEADANARVVFIGPCTAKKLEIRQKGVQPYVDSVLTFEELQALIDSREIDPAELPEETLASASYYGRIFARSCGVTDAVREALQEQGAADFALDPVTCDGIEQCKKALMRAARGKLPNNFIEGMACIGGCIGGAGCLTHDPKNKEQVDQFGREAERTMREAAQAAEEEELFE